MDTTPPNPPAFPRSSANRGGVLLDAEGLSMRDWFAGQAMGGMIAALKHAGFVGWNEQTVAKSAYQLADAMLEHRTK